MGAQLVSNSTIIFIYRLAVAAYQNVDGKPCRNVVNLHSTWDLESWQWLIKEKLLLLAAWEVWSKETLIENASLVITLTDNKFHASCIHWQDKDGMYALPNPAVRTRANSEKLCLKVLREGMFPQTLSELSDHGDWFSECPNRQDVSLLQFHHAVNKHGVGDMGWI